MSLLKIPMATPMDDLRRMVKVSTTGRGTYGIVYTAQPVKNNVDLNNPGPRIAIAVKRNRIESTTDFTGSLKELDILNRFRGHPFIVNLIAVTFGDPFIEGGGRLSPHEERDYKDDKVHFLFEHALYDCHRYIHTMKPPFVNLKFGMAQILLGIEFIHSKGIIHRDMKPSNILIFRNPDDNTPLFKICDFGLSKPYMQQIRNSPRMVTSWYRAPEICLEWPDYTTKIDLWSIGCIFFEMIAKYCFLFDMPDSDDDIFNVLLGLQPEPLPRESLNKMFKVKKIPITAIASPNVRKSWTQRLNLTPNELTRFNTSGSGTYDQFISLLGSLLAIDPDKRLNATEALNHPFFSGYREYIQEVRKHYPPTKPELPKMSILRCQRENGRIKLPISSIQQEKCIRGIKTESYFRL